METQNKKQGATMDNQTTFPGWKNALEEIVAAVEVDGYGQLFTHTDLKKWMKLETPKTIEEYKRHELDYLSAIESLRNEALFEHLICLSNEIGEGYRALEPNEQIEKVPRKHIEKASRELKKAANALQNVRTEMLSLEISDNRLRQMARIAFIKAAFNKRKLPDSNSPTKAVTSAQSIQ